MRSFYTQVSGCLDHAILILTAKTLSASIVNWPRYINKMEIKKKKGYIAIYGDTLPIKIDRFLMGGNKEIKAAALPPFIFFQDKKFEVPWVVNHELIHFKQNYELLYFGSFLLSILERLYYKFILGMSSYEAYIYSSGEQEAYLNHNNPEYLKNRRIFSVFKYLFSKKKIKLGENGAVTILKD
jgi:hypothetical protein